MSEGFPPLEISNITGTFRHRPVYEIETSGGTLERISPIKVRIGIPAGGGGSGITPPLVVSSGGTGITTTGSATTIVGVNTSGTVFDYYTLSASTNISISRTGTTFTFSSTAGGGARIYHSSDQTVVNNSAQYLTFDTERYDTDGFHDNTNARRLTALVKGIYAISACIRWEGNSTGVRDLGLKVNGSTYIVYERDNATGTSTHSQTATTIYELNSADYVEVEVLQNSGGSRLLTFLAQVQVV